MEQVMDIFEWITEELLEELSECNGGNTEKPTNICKKCKVEEYYAEPEVGFICWGCKNGY